MSNLRTLQRIFLALLLTLAGAVCSLPSSSEGWSVDLRNYGIQEWRDSNGLRMSSDFRMAAANNAIAIALGNPSVKTQTGDPRTRANGANWQILLLVFDAKTGSLRSKGGPWTADSSFELFSTSQGNFLLLLRHYSAASEEPGETLLLFSSAGNELKKFSLPPSILLPKPGSKTRSRTTWNIFRVSSSGGTVLIGQTLEDGVHYKLLEADTLNTKLEWTAETGPKARTVIALSDKELLGLGKPESPQQKDASNGPGQLFVKEYDGSWTPFPISLDLSSHAIWASPYPNQLAFLSEHTLVGVVSKREKNDAPVAVVRTDGATVFSPIIPKLAENTTLFGPVNVSQDGRYFSVGFQHRPWLSHLMLDVWQMDIAFQSDEFVLVVWESSRPISLAQLQLGSVYDVRGLSFVLDDPPSIALLGRSTLKVVPVRVR